jgi:hypothetical protein
MLPLSSWLYRPLTRKVAKRPKEGGKAGSPLQAGPLLVLSSHDVFRLWVYMPFLFPHSCYISYPSNPPWFDHTSTFMRRIQIIKVIMQFFQFPVTFIVFGLNVPRSPTPTDILTQTGKGLGCFSRRSVPKGSNHSPNLICSWHFSWM